MLKRILKRKDYQKLKKFNCYSVDFGKDFSEKNWIKFAANKLNVNYDIQSFSKKDFLDSIKPMIWHLEGPSGGLMNCALKMVFERAFKTGTTVLLDGTGLDEAFGGYRYHHNLFLVLRLILL